jgi:hypothetical protein
MYAFGCVGSHIDNHNHGIVFLQVNVYFALIAVVYELMAEIELISSKDACQYSNAFICDEGRWTAVAIQSSSTEPHSAVGRVENRPYERGQVNWSGLRVDDFSAMVNQPLGNFSRSFLVFLITRLDLRTGV